MPITDITITGNNFYPGNLIKPTADNWRLQIDITNRRTEVSAAYAFADTAVIQSSPA